VHRYVRWKRDGHLSSTGECVGITGTVAKALGVAQWAGKSFAGSHDPKQLDADVLVRTGVVALYASSHPERVFEWAVDAARVTHQAPGLLDACRYHVALLLAALRGATRDTLLNTARDLIEEHCRAPLRSRVMRLVEADAYPTENEPRRSDAYTALRNVLWALGTGGSYRDAIIAAVNLGMGSDVTGALCGQLAGALYGVGAMPPAWRGGVASHALIEDFGDRLLAAALAPSE
jgi:ADP-ribosyl-[dinitrogen reductase] hydrolase